MHDSGSNFMHGDENCARKQKKAKSNMVIDGLGRCIHTSIMTWVVPQPEFGIWWLGNGLPWWVCCTCFMVDNRAFSEYSYGYLVPMSPKLVTFLQFTP